MPRITLTDFEAHVTALALDDRFKALTTRLNTYDRYLDEWDTEATDYDDVSMRAHDTARQLARIAVVLNKLRKGTV